MNVEITDLDMILNHLETTILEPHDDYTSEFTYKDQKILYRYIKELQQERNQFKEYTNHNYDKAKKLQQENQLLKDKIALRNKEKTDICNRIHNQKEKIKRHKAEITNLIAKNQQLKIQISPREEEYRKLEDNWKKLKVLIKEEICKAATDYKLYDKSYILNSIDNKMQELERGVSDDSN